MEKIYMEENKNNKKKRSIVDVSVVLSFVVALFAVFSLVACGFDQVSYAAPTGDKLTFYLGENEDGSQRFVRGWDASDNVTFIVPLYYSDAERKTPIFCIEHTNTNTTTGTEYNIGNEIKDYGLLYLLNNSYVNGKKNVPTGDELAEAWVTQTAIWLYLAEKEPTNPAHTITADELAKIKATTMLDDTYNALPTKKNYGVSLYDKYVAPLVAAAKNASNVKKLYVNKDSDDIAKTTDGKFYQTAAISVVGNPSGDMNGYDIKLDGISGAIAVDESGKEIATNVGSGTKFYVRIPVDKVTEEAQTLEINVVGHFKTLTGHEYNAVDGAHQKIVSVTGDVMDVAGGTSIEVVGAPDTGMNTAQTIYFIGLIVLLCGVGIIYANAKPVQNQ